MSPLRTAEYLAGLVNELRRLPGETEWVEFKVDNVDPVEIGRNISALANGAALVGKTAAYIVWGIENGSHAVIGTSFEPRKARQGSEELESWLLKLLTPKIEFRFHELDHDGKRLVLLEVPCASRAPVQFQGHELIRVGSYTKPLKDFPEKERELWKIFSRVPFERGVALEHVTDDEVLRRLDAPAYYELLGLPLPDGTANILAALAEDGLLARCPAGGWNITNLGAILFAKQLSDFGPIGRKAVRVIVYKGTSRIETVREQVGTRGYASGFSGLISFINGLVPSNEVIEKALRKTVPMYPELAVRELVANALIHQDFFVTGAGPMVEIFADRMEVTNPGAPLVRADRFLDSPPRSRNEALASLLRRMKVCEERGSGVDKVVFQTELFQLPAPLFEVPPEATRAVLFGHRALTKMDRDDRVRACYLHACLKYVGRDFLTNTSVRERFGIAERNKATASRLIKEAVGSGVITAYDAEAAPKLMKYVPWWAVPGRDAANGGS
jgi:predicted HTH transcriptional regulator